MDLTEGYTLYMCVRDILITIFLYLYIFYIILYNIIKYIIFKFEYHLLRTQQTMHIYQ